MPESSHYSDFGAVNQIAARLLLALDDSLLYSSVPSGIESYQTI